MSSVIAEGSISDFLAYGNVSHVFRPNELEVYKFVRNFVQHYGALPTEETITTHTGEAMVPHTEPSGYYFDLMETRHVELSVKKAMQAASDQLGVADKDPDAALVTLTEAVMSLAVQKNQAQITDFRHAYDILVPDYVAKYNYEAGWGLTYGWPTLDGMTGGVRRGDLISVVGRPALGKTFQMLYGAHHGWAQVGALKIAHEAAAGSNMQMVLPERGSRMFVSMEMNPLPIQQRLAAMHSHIPLTQLNHAELSTFGLKKLKQGLTEIKGYFSPFWIVDGNLASTVEDIWMLARQLKPDAIFIDGGYLVKHPSERDRYRRVAENADLMKQELASLAPTTVSWQFAKSASKKKKGEKVTGDDVGYSDAIYQVSSILMGLFQPDSVETLNQRKVEILKGRSGEVGSFRTNWDFNKMIFSEILPTDVEDLQFI